MAEPISFWRRVGNLFRPGGDATDGNGAGESSGAITAAAPAQAAGWLRRPAKAAQAREVALHVAELADAMQQYFRQQDQRAAELAGSLNRVGGVLEQLAESQRSHGDYLRTIAEQTESAGKNAAALTATVSRVPESLLAQADAIRTVARQLEISQEADTQLMHSLQQFGRAVDTLGSSGTAQVEVLQRLNHAQQQQHEAFSALVREQSRRFTVVFAVAAGLVVLAVGALAAVLVVRGIR